MVGPLLPEDTEKALSVRLGTSFGEWQSKTLPAAVEAARRQWDIEIDYPIGGSTAAVFAATHAEHGPVVLKVHIERARVIEELRGWRTWHGVISPRLWAEDVEHAMFLQERLLPGTSMEDEVTSDLVDAAAALLVRIVIMRPGASWPPLATMVSRKQSRARKYIDDGAVMMDIGLLDLASELSARLLVGSPRQVPLHGDYFPDNILRSDDRGWLAIDPQACLGEAAFDAGVWSYACERGGNVARHAGVFARALDLDLERVLDWAAVAAITNVVFRAAWGHLLEGEWDSTITFAKTRLGQH